MGFSVLLYGDLHYGPTGRTHAFERPDLGSVDVDVVVTIGDVVDENVDHGGRGARRYERRGRAFFEHLDAEGVPVVAVPGNHDPVGATGRLTEGLENVLLAHERVVRADDLPGDADLDGCTLVGLGCEQFDQSMTVPYMEYETIDPRTNATHETIGWVADDAADQVEAAVAGFLTRDVDVDDVADELGVERSARRGLATQLDALHDEFVTKRGLLSEHDHAIALSHVSPFNTTFDYHHSFDDLDGRLHRGSISLKMAIAATAPLATFCGHVHQRARDVLETVRGPREAYNPGNHGVAIVEIDRRDRTIDVQPDPF